MKRSEVTFTQLDRVLRALGYSSRPTKDDPPGRFYEHTQSGSMILLPSYSDDDRLYEYHMVGVRTELDNFGIATPAVFAAKLQKAG